MKFKLLINHEFALKTSRKVIRNYKKFNKYNTYLKFNFNFNSFI